MVCRTMIDDWSHVMAWLRCMVMVVIIECVNGASLHPHAGTVVDAKLKRYEV